MQYKSRKFSSIGTSSDLLSMINERSMNERKARSCYHKCLPHTPRRI